ncbi:DNA repair protein RadA [Commensalibacter oyaizuii]|uniref:DNA repair protein RadA n=1 Tax=Commensalibacter oyaizuii TaxID=3043873 RepID=A0ABT6Q364_9PROT|nr:DNA repair protein RadA [Commensalibacter sp. TBRC 16381]MDI2091428.1 DNA repair protein RadA [Commensalibacter sp. TBRC 16381]
MAKKPAKQFVCQSCGSVYPKWMGRCEACGEWNTVEEERQVVSTPLSVLEHRGQKIVFSGLDGDSDPPPRQPIGIDELDRVLGGGLVQSSVSLVGGDPGIGKSTLLLQAACALSNRGLRVLYISGEESINQIRMRANRLGLEGAEQRQFIELAASINVSDILATLDAEKDITLVIIDSIQTMWLDTITGAPGTVSQVRAAAFELIRMAKKKEFSLIFVGHVTKEGSLAGPRVLEHMVDAVLYFEGDRGHQFRILRAAKNRFGATDEIGVFSMTGEGLVEVSNPSALFLAERHGHIAGSAVFAGLEGTRPVLLEVQALLAPKYGDGAPRRTVVGWDSARLNMLLAILETRCSLKFNGVDVYLNMAGGLRISEPAADLAVAAALISALTHQPTSPGSVFFGEIGLSGEVRQVPQADLRVKEAHKLGFDEVVLPKRIARGNTKLSTPKGLNLSEIGHISDLVSQFSIEHGS